MLSLQAQPDKIEFVKGYISDHLSEPLDRGILARIACISIPHFHRMITRYAGENPAGYVRRTRLERAGRKLRAGAVNITEVALAAGYDTHAALCKDFKQHFGLSPSEFRQLGCRKATQTLRKR